MKKVILLFAAVLTLGCAFQVDAQKKKVSRPAKKTAVTTTVADPFKGKYQSANEVAEINFYKPTVKNWEGKYIYGTIEGVYQNGNRLDEHEVIAVKSVDGNTAVITVTCGYGGETFDCTATYNPAKRTLTIKPNTSDCGMCYQQGAVTLRRK